MVFMITAVDTDSPTDSITGEVNNFRNEGGHYTRTAVVVVRLVHWRLVPGRCCVA